MATVAPITVRTRRNTELGLLVIALAISIFAYVSVGINQQGGVPADTLAYSAGLCVLALGFHIVLRIKAPYADPVMLPVTTTITGIGLAMLGRLTYTADQKIEARYQANIAAGLDEATAHAKAALPTNFDGKQLLWMSIGIVAAIVVIWILRDHRTLRRFTYTAMVASIVLLLLPLLPGIGKTINGASIWIRIGPATFQPAEAAKITLAIFFAGYLVTNRETMSLAGKKVLGLQLPRLRDMGPIALVWASSIVVLILEKDLGTSLLFFGLFIAMLYIATQRVSWIIIGLSMFVVGAALAAKAFSHVGARIDVWLNALDPAMYSKAYGGSYQLVQGLFGFANGGLLGTGLGLGRPDLVPYAESDFIIASIAEELGLAGFVAIILLYLILIERGLRTALGVRDGFGKLLAGGLAFTMALQVFIVVGGVTRIIPLTGLTLPFLAYGGSSVLANWIIIALLLRISDSARRPALDVPGPARTATAPVTSPASVPSPAPMASTIPSVSPRKVVSS